MGTIFVTLRAWSIDDAWPIEEFGSQLHSTFAGDSGRWSVVAVVNEDSGTVSVLSVAPFAATKERCLQTMEAVTRANFGLTLGSFDFDPDSGAIQFRTSLDVQGSEKSLTGPVLRHLVYANVLTMERYLPALRAVAEDGIDPSSAIAAAES